jgi:hypothetical protein
MIRLKKILKEYNESLIWNSLSLDKKREILSTIDINGIQQDLANHYDSYDWLKLPDYITNRINLQNIKTASPSTDRTLNVGDVVKYSGATYRIEKLGEPNSAGQIFHLGRDMSNNYTAASIPQKGTWEKIS